MTCESALVMLLDAEPCEFSANERTPLGAHLRSCGRCRRVATQLTDDTQRLAVAMNSAVLVRRPARRAVRVSLAPALAVAALVFAVVLRSRPAGTPVREPTRVAQPAPAPAAVSSTTPNVSRAPERDTRVRPIARRAFARAVPLAPVRLATSEIPAARLSVESSGVTVTPPAGTRATVMHTSNPKLVVVWLH
jgi:hypothetical protein